MLNGIDLSHLMGYRNRAILEVLCSTGIRWSGVRRPKGKRLLFARCCREV